MRDGRVRREARSVYRTSHTYKLGDTSGGYLAQDLPLQAALRDRHEVQERRERTGGLAIMAKGWSSDAE